MANNFFDLVRRVEFSALDLVRQMQGDSCAILGLGPSELPYQIVEHGRPWRLRDYRASNSPVQPSLLIIAAPIKRPYIWDLAHFASAVRFCLDHDLHVYLLEWLPPSAGAGNNGLAEYVSAIAGCVAAISNTTPGAKPFLIGHSLGGTLATMYGALAPESIRGLVMLSTPLCFSPDGSSFRDALVSLVPAALGDEDPFPGSQLTHISALASPATFIWSRFLDAALSIADARAMELHARVERWALDEVALPGRLVHQIIEWLYRENRLCRGILDIGARRIGPSGLSVPTLAIVNLMDDVAPLTSVKPFLDAAPEADKRIIEYAGETGVCLQHLGILIGRDAHAHIWPEIIAWVRSHA